MTIREQVEILRDSGVDMVVVGGQAGVLRQAVEFSHDLDILVRPTGENAERLRQAILRITGIETDIATLLGRDFQQYVNPVDATEIDVHLKLEAIPDFECGRRNSSEVDFLGVPTPCLELPALYASKRTDRARDALHRLAIEARLRHLVLAGEIEPDEVVLACCLDETVARQPEVAHRTEALASSTRQPLLQARLLAHAGSERLQTALASNPALHPRVRTLLNLDLETRSRILTHPNRLAALLATLPLELPPEGYRVRARTPQRR